MLATLLGRQAGAKIASIRGRVTSVLMVLTIKILISFGRVSSHFIGPLKVRFILDLFQHLVDRLLKH